MKNWIWQDFGPRGSADTLEAVATPKEKTQATKSIILYNDNVNTFDHVMSCLIEYCKHTETQAEQCAMLAHMRGKYAVKNGSFTELAPIAEALGENGLTVTIE